jgi:methylenetetrahydrofolate dehydrogenase (NADP+)/methenyltetrahydrofolate cyclohydrolase
MMAEPLLLDGTKLAREIEANLAERSKAIIEKTGVQPVLATIIVGEYPPSVMYIKYKVRACKRSGIKSKKVELPEETTTEELIQVITRLNNDKNVFGILLQSPLPKQIDQQLCFNTIALHKDVDGVNTASFGAMTMGIPCLKPATPFGIMSLMEHYGIQTAGKEAVIIGRSTILGKPVAMLLLNADATVTVCHSKTKGLPDVVRRADIVVAALGRPKFIQADWIKDGAVLIDAGYNEGAVGDIDLERAIPKSSAYTPVPGGVGPMTIAKLMEQTIIAAETATLPSIF